MRRCSCACRSADGSAADELLAAAEAEREAVGVVLMVTHFEIDGMLLITRMMRAGKRGCVLFSQNTACKLGTVIDRENHKTA
eukprot:scaffold899_cov90-Skeletonema_dohrnii-CCMP3373.AAC.3